MSMRPPVGYFFAALGFAACISGCGDSNKPAAKPASTNANSNASTNAKTGESIIGKKTQTVLDAEPELAKGAVICTDLSNPYYSALVKVVVPGMQHNLDIHHAATDTWPQNAQEFVDQNLIADNVALDKLPYYLEYGYDAKEHKLIVLEYPERKKKYQSEHR